MRQSANCNICKKGSGKVLEEVCSEDVFLQKDKLAELLKRHKDEPVKRTIKIRERHDYYVCLRCLSDFKDNKIDPWGKKIQFVTVKCPHCTHKFKVEMRWLVWKYNCEKCKSPLTTDDRIKKTDFNFRDFR